MERIGLGSDWTASEQTTCASRGIGEAHDRDTSWMLYPYISYGLGCADRLVGDGMYAGPATRYRGHDNDDRPGW